jgi:hypothetical protein
MEGALERKTSAAMSLYRSIFLDNEISFYSHTGTEAHPAVISFPFSQLMHTQSQMMKIMCYLLKQLVLALFSTFFLFGFVCILRLFFDSASAIACDYNY